MIHFLRNKNNETIVDIEAMKDDISCSIIIDMYSKFLLELPSSKQQEFINDIDVISEIRGIYFERYDAKIKTDDLAKQLCKILSEKWDLFYITD